MRRPYGFGDYKREPYKYRSDPPFGTTDYLAILVVILMATFVVWYILRATP